MQSTMKAAVVHEAGDPEVLKIETRDVPRAEAGEVLIRVEAFGINRSEMFTRQGHSPDVQFPRVLGIEATGTITEAPGGEFPTGAKVMTVMGGMGRKFDGAYAQYVKVRAENVRSFESDLAWSTLGALPEMLQTAWGSLHRGLRLQKGERLLVRGGTTTIGLAAAALAKAHGAEVAGTSRRNEGEKLVRDAGADRFFLDDGSIADVVKRDWEGGADKVLELIGTNTLADSLASAREPGIVCMTGMVGDNWSFSDFAPMDVIPTAVSLTTYAGGADDLRAMPLQNLIDQVAAGTLPVPKITTFPLDEIVAAHQLMESNRADGKIVVLPW